MTLPARAELDAIFLDAGNTLVSMDFAWIARELADLGHAVDAAALARGEAAARPVVSQAIEAGASTEGFDLFGFYMATALGHCLALDDGAMRRVITELGPRLRLPGESDKLWCAVLPGVPEALGRLRDAGLRLVVVSNSDGSIERGLRTAGLHDFFDAIVDSQVVGFEKPDPRIFTHALAQSRTDPARTLHVGDMYGADVRGARAAGVHAVLLDPHDDWPPLDCATLRGVPELADALLP